MILIVSGRTDIIAFYTPWFLKRLKEGFVDVINPFNPKLVSRINFADVDAFLFCTKNPLPIIPYLKQIKKPILFHITITPYQKDIEPNVISKAKIIEGVKKIGEIIGKENVYVRYDPLFLNSKYTLEYHLKAMDKLSTLLENSIAGFIISFLDNYKNVQKNYHFIKPQVWQKEDYKALGIGFSSIGKKHHLTMQMCGEKETLEEYGFIKNECLSSTMAYRLTGKNNFKKWNARHNKYCNCVEMVDIGAYNSCGHLCKYCYANFDEDKIKENRAKHDVNSTCLIGTIPKDAKINVRKN